MTLRVLDEAGQEVNTSNPIITEHNGSTGDAVTLSLTLINKSAFHYYKNIRLWVNSVFPVSAELLIPGERVPNYRPSKSIVRFDPNERLQFNLRLSVGPDTPEQVVRGINLGISSMRYPSL